MLWILLQSHWDRVIDVANLLARSINWRTCRGYEIKERSGEGNMPTRSVQSHLEFPGIISKTLVVSLGVNVI